MYKPLLILILVAAVCTLLVVACSSKKEAFKTIDSTAFSALINGDKAIQLLDVRTPDEYTEGHIAGALLINVNDSDFAEQASAKLNKSQPVAVYCRAGRRSAKAARILIGQGFTVTNLDGGFLAWQKAGMPIEK